MSIEAHQTAEIQVENIADFAQFIAAQQNVSQSSVVSVANPVVQVSDVSAPILQVQDAIANGTIIQVSESSVAPIVQLADQTQGVYITEGIPNGIQVLDGSFPFVQSSDGSIIQLAPSMVSGAAADGLTQVVQFANGQIALIEHQENIDPQNVQHYVLEQVPMQQSQQVDGEMQQQQQQLMETAAPPMVHVAVKKEPGLEITKPPIGKGPFTCEICEKVCEKWNQYQRHLRSHEDDKPFRCFQCPASFNIADNLTLHLATHVEPGAKPSCPECGKKFSRVASLKAHIMLHEKEESLMCQECGDEFGLQSQLDRHMIEHREDKEGTRVYSCRQCNADFTTQKALKEHTKQHFKIKSSLSHRSYNKEIDRTGFSHKCSHCMKSFQKPSQLQRHMRIHTGDRPFKCTMCNKAFNQKGALQIHVLGRHSDKKPHKCQFCDVGFSQKGNLRAHIQRVHTLTEDTTDQTVHSCTECTCVFKKLGSLNAHISRFHTELDPNTPKSAKKKRPLEGEGDAPNDVIQQLLEFSATGVSSANQQHPGMAQSSDDILQQALHNSGLPGSEGGNKSAPAAQSGGVLSTMNVRDTATGAIKKHYVRKVGNVTWHQCSFCTKEFKKPSDLVRHTRIHSHEKPYKCTQCFRAFAVKSTLNSHIRTHTGIKQFKCNVCDKNFSTHGSLKVHLRLHTGAKPFDCPHCDKKFRTAAHRKSHIAAHFKSPDKNPMRSKVDGSYKKIMGKDMSLPEVPLQEPILITDTGLIQQPPRSTMFNQYLGESGSVDRPYKCSFCQRGFKKSSHLKQHIRSHTGEKPYKCLTCMRTFVSNGVLKAHIRIHTGMKQYKCLMCDNMFSTNGSLKRHMSTHSDVRPFMCPYCQRTFKTNVNCKKHMKTHRHELAMQSMSQQSQMQHAEEVPQPVQDQEVGQLSQETSEYVEEEAVDNDLTLVQHELHPTSHVMSQPDITQQTILTQTGLQDALGLTGTNIDQQILNQQLYGQQQTFTQSLLGSGQQNFQQMNSQLAAIGQQQQSQFAIQQQTQQLNQIDLNQFTQQSLQQNVQSLPQLQGDLVQEQHVTHVPNIADSQQVQTIPNSDHQAITEQEVMQTDQLTNSSGLASTSMQNILETRDDDGDVEDDGDVPEEEETGLPDDQPIGYNEEGRRTYPCEHCGKVYKKSSHLKQHIRSHTGEKPYKCSRCGKTFVSMGVLRQHLRTHTGIKEYKCSVCSALFTTNGSLTRHMNIHVSIKPYKCPICLEAFRTAAICKRHMKMHSDEGDEAEDDDDEESVPRKSKTQLVELSTALTKPANDDLGLSERILIESASERERVSELKELTIQQEERHAHQCHHCSKSFKKPSDLIRHNRIHTGEKPFACGLCGRMFTVKSTLDSHMKTHGGFEKSIKCHVCNSLFSTKGSLKVHMRLHTGAKPFRCPHCPQRFRTSGHRKSHILSHYKPETVTNRKKRNAHTINLEDVPAAVNQALDFINPVETVQNQQQILNQGQVSQVINIDQSMIQGATGVMPMSITVDNYGNYTESALAAHVLQGLEGLQLHLTNGNLAQGIQISGLDPSVFNQTLQIDSGLLQQLQAGNINITLNAEQLQVAANPNLIQNLSNLQVQPVPVQEGINPNLVVQPLTIDPAGSQARLQPQIGVAHEVAPSSFVVTGDGTLATEQQMIQPQVVEMPPGTITESVTLNNSMATTDPAGNNLITVSSEITAVNPDNEHDQSSLHDNSRTNVMSVVNGSMSDVSNDMGVSVTSSIHGVVTNDLDQETSEMRAIDPNMTNNMGDNLTDITTDMIDEGDNQEVSDDDNDDADDSEMIQESVADEDQYNDEELIQDQDETFVPSTQTDGILFEMRNFECKICNKSFKRGSHLKEHSRIHMKDQPTREKRLIAAPHRCPYCGKSFQKPSQLDRHIRVHTGERPFVCEICRKAFNQKNALQMHLKKHTGDKPNKCQYCEKAFTQKGNLKTHIKRAHHTDMVSSMNIPKFDKVKHLEGVEAVEEGVGVSGVQEGKYVDEDAEGTEGGSQVVNQDLNLVEVADLFNN